MNKEPYSPPEEPLPTTEKEAPEPKSEDPWSWARNNRERQTPLNFTLLIESIKDNYYSVVADDTFIEEDPANRRMNDQERNDEAKKLSENVHSLLKVMHELPYYLENEADNLLRIILSSGQNEEATAAIIEYLLNQGIDYFINSGSDWKDDFYSLIFKFGNKEQQERAVQNMMALLADEPTIDIQLAFFKSFGDLLLSNISNKEKIIDELLFRNSLIVLASLLVDSRNGSVREFAIKRLETRNGLKLSPEMWASLVDHWATYLEPKEDYEKIARYQSIARNLIVLNNLESQKGTGAIEKLFYKYGIRYFGRYSDTLLLKQLEQEDNTNHPYGIVILPANDHNGAFYRGDILDNLSSQIGDDYLLRIFETQSLISLARILLSLEKKYGEKQKIAFALVGGHGETDNIHLGRDHDRNDYLSLDELEKLGAERCRRFFDQNATLILESCSTGQENGIAEKLSSILRLKVIGPKIDTSTEEIQYGLTENGPVFHIIYTAGPGTEAYYQGNR